MNNSSILTADEGRVSVSVIPLALGVVYALVTFVNVAGNMLVQISVMRFKKLRSNSNRLIMALSWTDLAAGIASMPLQVYHELTRRWTLGWPVCYIFRSVQYSCASASILMVCFIAIDRFIALKDPLKYPFRITRRVIWGFITTAWLLSCVPIFCWLYFFALVHSDDVLICTVGYDNTVMLSMVAILFFLPVIITIALYAGILRVVYSNRAKIRSNKAGAYNLKAVRTTSVIIGVFLALWSPFFVLVLIKAFYKACSESALMARISSISSWLTFVNSASNPIIYAMANPDFRSAFKNTLALLAICKTK